jgi:hypothetical protein
MSWHGGSRVFTAIGEAVEAREACEISEKDLFVAIIKALKEEGWDPNEAQVGAYGEESSVREALREFGVVEVCGAEHVVNLWQCEEEQGHPVDVPHRDYMGRTWSSEETAR